MDNNAGFQEIADFIRKRNIDETRALSKEHNAIFEKMPFVFEGMSSEVKKILDDMAMYQKNINVTNLNKESVFTSSANQMLDNLKYQRHSLHLTQLIKSREQQNDRDRKELNRFKEELQEMKKDIAKLPTREDNQKEVAVVKGKVANYEKFIKDAKKKEEKLYITPEISRDSFEQLLKEMDQLLHEREQLKSISDNITLARSSKKDLLKLKNSTKHM